MCLQNNVPAAADLTARGTQVAELVHVGGLGQGRGRRAFPPLSSDPRAPCSAASPARCISRPPGGTFTCQC